MNSVHFSSDDQTWETPADLFAVLNDEFAFTVDVCAQVATAKCTRFYTPEINGLAQDWRGVCWMNPPYGREIVKWMAKAHEAAATGNATVVCLVPARTDTGWWWKYARHGELRFLPGRLKFGNAVNSAPFPSAIVIFRPGLLGGGYVWHWDWQAPLDPFFGQCPNCNAGKGYLNIGRDQWCFCDEHRVKWCIGSNLFSDWLEEGPEIWAKNQLRLINYAEIEPWRTKDTAPGQGVLGEVAK